MRNGGHDLSREVDRISREILGARKISLKNIRIEAKKLQFGPQGLIKNK